MGHRIIAVLTVVLFLGGLVVLFGCGAKTQTCNVTPSLGFGRRGLGGGRPQAGGHQLLNFWPAADQPRGEISVGFHGVQSSEGVGAFQAPAVR